jgi:hypothetical protein
MQLTNLINMLLYIPVQFYLIPEYHRQHLNLEHTQQIHFPYCKVQFIKKFIHHSHSALDAVLAGTRAQSCDRYGSSTLQLWQDLGVVCHCFPPPLEVPTFAASCLYFRNDARNPSSERWKFGREKVR